MVVLSRKEYRYNNISPHEDKSKTRFPNDTKVEVTSISVNNDNAFPNTGSGTFAKKEGQVTNYGFKNTNQIGPKVCLRHTW